MYACMQVCRYACMHVCMYACMYACMYVCIYVGGGWCADREQRSASVPGSLPLLPACPEARAQAHGGSPWSSNCASRGFPANLASCTMSRDTVLAGGCPALRTRRAPHGSHVLMHRPLPDEAYTREPPRGVGLSGITHDPALSGTCVPHTQAHPQGKRHRAMDFKTTATPSPSLR